MDPWSLTAAALQEPWRLWTGHLAHWGWAHAATNAFALMVPLGLVPPRTRGRLLLGLAALAPLLSLALLPSLGTGAYRGASGLVCAAWAMAGLHLIQAQASRATGRLLLVALGLKLLLEGSLHGGVLLHPQGWQTLPLAHLWGAALGSALALSSPEWRWRTQPQRLRG